MLSWFEEDRVRRNADKKDKSGIRDELIDLFDFFFVKGSGLWLRALLCWCFGLVDQLINTSKLVRKICKWGVNLV